MPQPAPVLSKLMIPAPAAAAPAMAPTRLNTRGFVTPAAIATDAAPTPAEVADSHVKKKIGFRVTRDAASERQKPATAIQFVAMDFKLCHAKDAALTPNSITSTTAFATQIAAEAIGVPIAAMAFQIAPKKSPIKSKRC